MARKGLLSHKEEEALRKWAMNFVKFVILPTLVAVTGSLALNLDWRVAAGVAAGTLFNSAHDFLRKYQEVK